MNEISKAQDKYKNDAKFKKLADAMFNLLDTKAIDESDLLLAVSYVVTLHRFNQESE